MKMKLTLAALALCLLLPAGARAAPMDDIVRDLPGLDGDMDVRMYSGYVNPPNGHIHYLFVESEKSETDPLVLWLNGGPGASSLMGAFTELGPFIINGRHSLQRNPFAWNKVANVLYLESPAGVGFSYCDEMLQGKQCQFNDTSTAEINLAALEHFLSEKFPEYEGRDFMIWGESYAGVYVPTLAKLVYESDIKLNFLGFGVGDPCTDDKTQTFTAHLNFNLEFANQFGFVEAQNYAYLKQNCIASDIDGHIVPDESTEECKKGWRMYYLSTSGGGGNGPAAILPHGGFIDPYNAWGPNNEDFWEMLADYLADENVMAALHVQDYPLRPWSLFADHLNYTKQYMACYHDGETPGNPYYNYSMIEIYKELAGNLRNIVVFNGDTDPSVQMRGTEAAVAAMGFDTVQGGDWRPWFFQPAETAVSLLMDKSPWWGPFLDYRPLNSQLGGYVKNFQGNVSFVTVHDSGHMVPQYKPVAAFHLFVRGLLNKPLSPLLNESAVTGLSDDAFYGFNDTAGYMGQWTEEASSKDYTDSGEWSAKPAPAAEPSSAETVKTDGESERRTHVATARKVLRPPAKTSLLKSLGGLKMSQVQSLEKHELKHLMEELKEIYDAKDH